ncbi:helix-turn-helix domain-containing protein [Planctomycetaceae bacterium]|nr:helix-turn-helix domain-containing protein [Planctomycetaceae bacterium]
MNVGTFEKRKMITVREACQILELGKTKVYELLNTGEIPCHHFGRACRIEVRDLEEFLDRNREDGIHCKIERSQQSETAIT